MMMNGMEEADFVQNSEIAGFRIVNLSWFVGEILFIFDNEIHFSLLQYTVVLTPYL